jgi:hypothetical protein
MVRERFVRYNEKISSIFHRRKARSAVGRYIRDEDAFGIGVRSRAEVFRQQAVDRRTKMACPAV